MMRSAEDEEERAALRAELARAHARNALEGYHHERRVAQLGATLILTLGLLGQVVLAQPWRGLVGAGCGLLALGWALMRWRCDGCGRVPMTLGAALQNMPAPFNPPGCPHCGRVFRAGRDGAAPPP
jgi:hypothetical protein